MQSLVFSFVAKVHCVNEQYINTALNVPKLRSSLTEKKNTNIKIVRLQVQSLVSLLIVSMETQ